jgi:serine/threonine-protein kinase
MIGHVIGNYRIVERLGGGGMGEVYKAVDLMLERAVAVKCLPSNLTSETRFVERFRAEAVNLGKLSHPNIATLHSFFREGEQFFMVMEYVAGETLEAALRRVGAFAVEQALPVFLQTLDGVGHAHEKGIVHRDIKPANIMLAPGGIVKVMDFGIAHAVGSRRMTEAGRLIGTFEYMSPEQVRSEPSDQRADIYALGILLFEMLSGRVPFSSPSEYELMRAHVELPPPPLREFAPHAPEFIEQAILKALAKQREDRFQSVEEFRSFLCRNDFSRYSLKHASSRKSLPRDVTTEVVTTKAERARHGSSGEHLKPTRLAASEAETFETASHANAAPPANESSPPKIASPNDVSPDSVPPTNKVLLPVAPPTNVASPNTLTPPVEPETMGTRSFRSGSRLLKLIVEEQRRGSWMKSRRLFIGSVVAAIVTALIVAGRLMTGEPECVGCPLPVDSPPALLSPSPGASPSSSNPPLFKPEMAYVAGGSFRMGRDDEPWPGEDSAWVFWQRPAHEVRVNSFWIDRTEVTVAEYAAFVREQRYPPPPDWASGGPPPGRERWPVANVSFNDALAFARWRSRHDGVTYRLPTEAEWEYAARGRDARRYPWGDEWAHDRAQVEADAPCAVASYPAGASVWGVYDLIGNVSEWTASPPAAYEGRDVLPPGMEGKVVVRGGAYNSLPYGSAPVSATSRGFVAVTERRPTLGFRLVR